MGYVEVAAFGALVLAAASLARAWVPPQTRAVREILARVEELEADLADLHARLNKRSQRENMSKARDAHEERAARRDAIEHEALAIINQAKASPPSTPESRRAALRAALLQRRSAKLQ